MKTTRFTRLFCILLALLMVPVVALSAVVGILAEENDELILTDIEWKSWKMFQSSSDNPASPYRPSIDSQEDGSPLTIGGVVYDRGLRTHPDTAYPAEFVYDISAYDYTTFSAVVGKDSVGTSGMISFAVLADGVEIARTPAIPAGESYELICDVTGCGLLTLVTMDGGDGIANDSAGWGTPRLSFDEVPDTTPAPLPETETDPPLDEIPEPDPVPEAERLAPVYISDLTWKSWKMFQSSSDNPDSPYKPSINCAENGSPLEIGGVVFEKGLRTHPDTSYAADIVYDLSGYNYTHFTATVGKDQAGISGLIRFYVLADGVVVGRSPVLNAGESYELSCIVAGCDELTLRITDGGDGVRDDSAAWGDPILGYSYEDEVPAETEPPVTEPPVTEPVETDPPATEPPAVTDPEPPTPTEPSDTTAATDPNEDTTVPTEDTTGADQPIETTKTDDETTATPGTATPDVTTAEETTPADDGCASAVGVAALVLVAAAGVVVWKRKD